MDIFKTYGLTKTVHNGDLKCATEEEVDRSGYDYHALHENGWKINAKIRRTSMHVLCVVDC